METSPQIIAGLLERLGRLLANDGHEHGLRPAQWDALRYLSRANRFSRTPSALTAYLGSTKGTVSQTINALARKGWVWKVQDPVDKRSVRVALTEAGQALLDHDPLATTVAALAELSPALRDPLAPGLEAVLRQRLADNGGRPFGLCQHCRYFERDSPEGDPHRCGLLREPLRPRDTEKICVEQEPVVSP